MNMDWVNSGFPSSSLQNGESSFSLGERLEKNQSKHVNSENFDFKKFRPKAKSDLVVNKKKIEELEYLLKNISNQLVLLNGPPGCGKMETLLVVCKSLNIECVEWINPVHYEYENVHYKSELTSFEEFMIRASRYQNVLSFATKRVAVIKEIPNIFLRDNTTFHEFLYNFRNVMNLNLIFVLSSTELCRDLFPEKIKSDLSVKCINFNPLTQKSISSALNNIVQKVITNKNKSDLSDFISNISVLCNGDLRNAILTLHFFLSKEKLNSNIEKNKKSKVLVKSESLLSIQSDHKIDIFHGIGRILYAKKENNDLVHSPQEVANFFISFPGLFINMLYENYLNTFSSIHDVAKGSTNLSISDLLLHNWKEDKHEFTNLRGCGVSVASYGLMVYNSRPIKKFQQFNKGKSNNYTIYQKSNIISDFLTLNTKDMILDIRPYASHIPDLKNKFSEFKLLKT